MQHGGLSFCILVWPTDEDFGLWSSRLDIACLLSFLAPNMSSAVPAKGEVTPVLVPL